MCKSKLMVVEDDDDSRELLKEMLESEGFDVKCFAHGHSAIEEFETYKPDIIVTDIQMPKMSGLEMVEKIRSLKEKIYVVVVSAFSDANYMKKAIQLNVNNYILKPVDTKELFEVLEDITHEIEKDKIILEQKKQLETTNTMLKKKIQELKDAQEDISKQKIKEEELNAKLQKFIDTQDSIVILTDTKMVNFVNMKFLDFFGYKTLEDFFKKHTRISDFFEENDKYFHLKKLSSSNINWVTHMLTLSGRNRIVSMKNKDGVEFVFKVLLREFDQTSYIATFSDISDNILEKLELEQEAIVDQLTGAYNRVFFDKNIDRMLSKHKELNSLTGIIFIDIDDFKKVNDTLGHNVGDVVLQITANLIKKYIRDYDKLVRWGGEEFIVITQANSIKDVEKVAQNLRSVIDKHKYEDLKTLTCSFGCTLYDPTNNSSITEAIDKADKALYQAKSDGKNAVRSVI